jgi:hypothetical protein
MPRTPAALAWVDFGDVAPQLRRVRFRLLPALAFGDQFFLQLGLALFGLGQVFALSAPVTDILVLALLLAAGVRVARDSRRTWGLLVVAFALLGAGDGVMAWAQLGKLLQTPAANNLCWTTNSVDAVMSFSTVSGEGISTTYNNGMTRAVPGTYVVTVNGGCSPAPTCPPTPVNFTVVVEDIVLTPSSPLAESLLLQSAPPGRPWLRSSSVSAAGSPRAESLSPVA